MDTTRVAYDVGPLAGPRTGVGTAVDALRDALAADPGVELIPYVTSFRARPGDGVRRLPFPAALAHRTWQRVDWPRGGRALAGAEVVHGTNYVVPPSPRPRLVSVYDSWFLRHPDQAGGDVRRAGAVLRRAIGRGVTVHASSHATADALRELFPGVRVDVVHLGRDAADDAAGHRRRSPSSPAAATSSRSARSSGARTCPGSSRRSR